MNLTDEQKARVLEEFKTNPDIMSLTRLIFDDEELDGRSKEGRAIREFLARQGMNHATTQRERAAIADLDEAQQEFLMGDMIDDEMKPLEIARLVYNDARIVALSAQHRAVIDFLKSNRPEIINRDEIVATDYWTPPKAFSRALHKVSVWTGKKLEEDKLITKDRQCIENLLIFLRSPRLSHIINAYSSESDRMLFESEFVRAVWNKPDLTNDEINLYITVCTNYVRVKHVQKRLDGLNRTLEESNDQDITMRMTELIKTTSEELNQCEKRIESLTQKLNGDRSKRLEIQGKNNVSILPLVEAFQLKEERDRLVKMAQMRSKLIREEGERLETMDELKARVLGISLDEIA